MSIKLRTGRLVPAHLTFTTDGIPYSNTFDDVYHSADGGLGQAEHVFLHGNGLPARWRSREVFTILEIGFGLGLNFLTTWEAFRTDSQRADRLHYIAVEKHPFSIADLKNLYDRWPVFESLSQRLIQCWPSLIGGFHRLHFDNESVTLTLLFGDAAELLPELEAKADALFLDGFAPSKNPDLWSHSLCKELARLAAPHATLATYTVASNVRETLDAAGFITEKIPGFGRKREMLTGHWPARSQPEMRTREKNHAIIVGAGLAGTHCAERLAARGWTVEIIERNASLAEEASGNPSGIMQPILHMGDTLQAQFSRTAFEYAVRHLHALSEEGHAIQWGASGLLQLTQSEIESTRLAQIIKHHALPSDFVRCIDASEAAQLTGVPTVSGGCWFHNGAWVNPPSLCAANLMRYADRIIRHMEQAATRLERMQDGQWRVLAKDNAVIAEAPILILANAIDCKNWVQTNQLPLHPVRGQVTYLPALPGKKLNVSVTGNGYIAPMPTGGYCIGATFQHDDFDVTPRVTDHVENLARIEALLPGFTEGINPETLEGRVAWRITTPDRLPVFGALQTGLYAATGLGARGLLWASLGAELLAAKICGEPWPMEKELATAIDARRFVNND